MPDRSSAMSPRRLFDRFRSAAAGNPAMPGLLPQLQAYGGLQAAAARAQRPLQTLGRLGSLEVRLAHSAAEVRQAQKLRYRVFYKEGAAHARIRRRLFARRDIDAFDAHLRSSAGHRPCRARSQCPANSRRWSAPTGCCGRNWPRTWRLLQRGRIRHRPTDRAPSRSAIPRTRPLVRAGALSQQAHGRTAVARHLDLCAQHRLDVMFGCASLDGTDPSSSRCRCRSCIITRARRSPGGRRPCRNAMSR